MSILKKSVSILSFLSLFFIFGFLVSCNAIGQQGDRPIFRNVPTAVRNIYVEFKHSNVINRLQQNQSIAVQLTPSQDRPTISFSYSVNGNDSKQKPGECIPKISTTGEFEYYVSFVIAEQNTGAARNVYVIVSCQPLRPQENTKENTSIPKGDICKQEPYSSAKIAYCQLIEESDSLQDSNNCDNTMPFSINLHNDVNKASIYQKVASCLAVDIDGGRCAQ